jgi:ATP-grasp ribosomal peptide maturase
MGTVLVLTGKDDLTADAVVAELNKRRVTVARYDSADFPRNSQLGATLGSAGWGGFLRSDHLIELQGISAVWWRRPNEFVTPSGWSDEARAFALSEARVGLLGVLGSLPVRWVNHPACDSAASYKPVQLAVAARVGLEVPKTVITSDPNHAKEFMGSDEVIYKGMSGGVLGADCRHRFLPTTIVSASGIDVSLGGTAHLFQELVRKAYEVRLTVIGDQMFPVAIHAGSESAKLDWRTDYASLTYEPIELPADVEKGVRKLMERCDLVFGALDFAVTPEGRWLFFEINPSGQWHWLAAKTGLPMVAAMADLLAGKET